jgi:hypothetical protein
VETWRKHIDYGGSGMKASAFYNKFTAPCTTKSAQSVISTAETTFEAFLVSNFTFVDINEIYFWIDTVLNEEWEMEDWVKMKSLEECYERLAPRIINASDEDKESFHQYLETLDEEDLTRLYWKNNLIEFTDSHDVVKKIWDVVFSSIIDYDYMTSDDDFSVVPEEYLEEVRGAKSPSKKWASIVDLNRFYDPNDAPKSIEKYVIALKDIYMQYVYVEYMYTDRIYKLKNFPRNVVTVIDTDSNILSLDTFMEYCISTLMTSDYGREEWDNVFVAINTITYTITAAITKTLLFYGEMSNVEESIRPRYSMKNEFFFANLIIAKVKKRYLSKILLREGHRLTKPKYDVKGFDFKKASTSQESSDFFMHVVKDLVLGPDEIDIKKIMIALQDFRNKVRKSIEAGSHEYLPLGNAKELIAYDNPEREQSVRGALAWNTLYPDRSVDLPIKLSILKTNIFTLEDAAPLKESEPEIYERIKTGIFEDTTGIFRKKGTTDDKDCKGLAVVGIPLYEDIPKWLLPYIDYTTVINSVVAPFKSVTETFNMPSIEEGKTGRKTTGFSNIIRV